jgi:hypothetical protein
MFVFGWRERKLEAKLRFFYLHGCKVFGWSCRSIRGRKRGNGEYYRISERRLMVFGELKRPWTHNVRIYRREMLKWIWKRDCWLDQVKFMVNKSMRGSLGAIMQTTSFGRSRLASSFFNCKSSLALSRKLPNLTILDAKPRRGSTIRVRGQKVGYASWPCFLSTTLQGLKSSQLKERKNFPGCIPILHFFKHFKWFFVSSI